MVQKLKKVLTTFLISLATFALLVAGTYAYNRIALTKPLEDKVTKIPAIGAFSYEKLNSAEKIVVEFTEPDKLRTSFYQLLNEIQEQTVASGDLIIEINNIENNSLASFFKEARLPIHEAISTGEFVALPQQLDKMVSERQVQYNLEVDSDFIFLSAIDGPNSAYLVIKCSDLPLTVITTMGGEYL
ncbi:MAG: hypothetical protein WBL58_01645 [Peptococcia bacterium]